MLALEAFRVSFQLCATWFEKPQQAFDESASPSILSAPQRLHIEEHLVMFL